MKKVILFSLTTCSFCQGIKKMLTDLKVDFTCYEADELDGEDKEKILAELRTYNPKCSFPTTIVDETIIVGYNVQEIKETIGIRTEIDDLYDMLKKINVPKGFFLNQNKEKTFDLLRGLLTNKKRYGYMACPCRLASGEKDKDRDIICPCIYRSIDVEEFGSCYCGLYVSKDYSRGKIEYVDVPERRPPERS